MLRPSKGVAGNLEGTCSRNHIHSFRSMCVERVSWTPADPQVSLLPRIYFTLKTRITPCIFYETTLSTVCGE